MGKVDKCQVGIYLGYVSRREHALANVRLYLPEEWTKDPKRCRAAGIPKTVKFQTRHDQALEMLDESGPSLPHSWIAGDDEMGRCVPFREALRTRGERYLLAVPSNTLVRDGEVPPPEYSGRGRHPKVPWQRVDQWRASQSETAWTLMHKLRRAMVRPDRDRLRGRVEVDEAYWGGEEEGVVVRQTQTKALIAVAGEEQGSGIGRIRLCHITTASREQLHGFIRDSIEPGSTVHTDGLNAYLEMTGYTHDRKVQRHQPAGSTCCPEFIA